MTHADARGEFVRVAQRLGSQTALAGELGVSRALVSLIVRGRRRPGGRLAAVIEQRYGIPAAAWWTE